MKTTVYQLIEAGQMARAALARPLSSLGLEMGDDAVIFALSRDTSMSDSELSALTGLGLPQLLPRLERLIRLDLIIRADAMETGAAGSRLTERGADLRKKLLKNWKELDEALLGDIKPKQAKKLKKTLSRFTELLSF